MGRQLKNPRPVEFTGLPIYRGEHAWNWHYKDHSTGKQKTIRLAGLGASPADVIAIFNDKLAELNELPMHSTAHEKGSVSDVIARFFVSPTFSDLSKGTKGQYEKNARQVLKVFGKSSNGKPIMTDNLKPQHIRRYMDLRGKTAKISANRELAFLSRVFAWAYERGIVASNPCKGVRKFSEKARDRYITDKEYFAVLAQSDDRLRAIIEIAYCCAARIGDVLKIQRQDIGSEGLYIKQGKTGKAQIKAWTPRLRDAIDIAKRVGVQHTRWVLTNSHGNRVTYDVFRRWWAAAKEKAEAEDPNLKLDFTFHDIKAKSISDWDGDKQRFSGHKSQSQVAVYDRKIQIVGTHE